MNFTALLPRQERDGFGGATKGLRHWGSRTSPRCVASGSDTSPRKSPHHERALGPSLGQTAVADVGDSGRRSSLWTRLDTKHVWRVMSSPLYRAPPWAWQGLIVQVHCPCHGRNRQGCAPEKRERAEREKDQREVLSGSVRPASSDVHMFRGNQTGQSRVPCRGAHAKENTPRQESCDWF